MPKTTNFVGQVNSVANLKKATKNWGRTSVQSYVEDITGRTALGVRDVGSGMRGLTLAAKLRMKTANTTSEPGFRAKMYQRFPQLLTDSTTPVGGAAHYNNLIHGEQGAQMIPGPTATQTNLANRVKEAHWEVSRESRNRFNTKWAEIEAGNLTTTQAGKWWVNKFGAGGKRYAAPGTAHEVRPHDAEPGDWLRRAEAYFAQ